MALSCKMTVVPDLSVRRNETVDGKRMEGNEVRFDETTDDCIGKSKATRVNGERIRQLGEEHTVLAPSGDDGADGAGPVLNLKGARAKKSCDKLGSRWIGQQAFPGSHV